MRSMPQAITPPSTIRYHSNDATVERLEAELIDLLLGARKQRKESKASMLRKDIRRKRVRPFLQILKVALADIHDGEEPLDVSAFAHALTGMIEQHKRDCSGDLSECIAAEIEVDSQENPLETAILRGDRSYPTLRKIQGIARRHIEKLSGLVGAVDRTLLEAAK